MSKEKNDLSSVLLSDTIVSAEINQAKAEAAFKALYSELGVGSELTDFRMAYIKSNYESIKSLFDIVLDYNLELKKDLAEIKERVEA